MSLSRAQRASGLQIFSRVLERERFVLVPVAVCAQSRAQCLRKKETDNQTRDGTRTGPHFEAGRIHNAMEDESTALREASKAGDAACVALLLRAGGGGGIDEACPLGWTALHNAAFSGSAAVTCALLAHGADLAARTKIGATALHVASFNGRLDVCKLLVVHGADVHATDRDGITPLEDARYRTLDRCCAVETPAQQWSKSAAFLAKVSPAAPASRTSARASLSPLALRLG